MKWVGKTLGEICTFRAGIGFKTEFQGETTGDYPFIKVSDMNLTKNQIRINTANNWITETVLERINAKPFQAGTTVFAKIGEALKQNRVRLLVRDTIIDNNMMGAIPKRELVEAEFLYHRLSMFDFAATSSGAALPFLTVKVLAESRVSIPPLPVQREIADVLSAYDELMENNRRRMELLEESVRLLYREWFVRLRFPGHEHARITNGVPEGWERVPFEHALVLQRGFDLPEREWEEGEFPICCSTGIVGHHKEAKVKGPGVFTGRSGSLGVVNYVEDDYWPHNTALWVREFKKVTPLFALFLLREMRLEQYNGGASVPTLDRKAVHRVPVLIPPRKFITLFDEFLTPMFAQLRNLREQNKKLRAARDLLLPRLMSGEIAV